MGSLGSWGSLGSEPIEPIEQDPMNLLNPLNLLNPRNLMTKRLHDRSLEVRLEIRRRRGGHQHGDEVFGRIDPEVRP
jgi:hypothetical protein